MGRRGYPLVTKSSPDAQRKKSAGLIFPELIGDSHDGHGGLKEIAGIAVTMHTSDILGNPLVSDPNAAGWNQMNLPLECSGPGGYSTIRGSHNGVTLLLGCQPIEPPLKLPFPGFGEIGV